jgi:hypothetical protein
MSEWSTDLPATETPRGTSHVSKEHTLEIDQQWDVRGQVQYGQSYTALNPASCPTGRGVYESQLKRIRQDYTEVPKNDFCNLQVLPSVQDSTLKERTGT